MGIPISTLNKGQRAAIGIFGLVFGAAFFAVGCFQMSRSVLRGLKQNASLHWSETNGFIIETVAIKPTTDNRESPITYSYSIAGVDYLSNRVAFIDAENISYQDWLELSNGLPRVGELTVYYDPRNPKDSVLKRGFVASSWQGWDFGLVFASFAAFWMTSWWVISNWLPDRLMRLAERKVEEQVG